MKKIKSIKTILEKNIIKNEKKKHVGKHCSNPQYFKEKNYKAKLSTSSILKKIKSIKTILKKNTKKCKKKKIILEIKKQKKKKKTNGKKNM
jgi:hypothetical protein